MSQSLSLLFLLSLALTTQIMEATNESQVVEIPYEDIWSHSVEKEWLKSVDQWYTPLWSKSHRNRIIAGHLDTPVSELEDTLLGKSACYIFSHQRGMVGYGVTMDWMVSMTLQGIQFKSTGKVDIEGFQFFRLTDNKTFVLGITLYNDGLTGWNVKSVTPTLPDQVEEKILKYVESMGFKRANVVRDSYDTCTMTSKRECEMGSFA